MDQNKKTAAADNGEVTTLRDYLAISVCLFGAFFISVIAALAACGIVQATFDTITCPLTEECDLSEIIEYAETQTFIFTLHAIGLGFIASLLSLPLCAVGGLVSLHFRLHPSLSRNLYSAAGFICGALYGALLYITVGERWEDYKIWIFIIAFPVAGGLACWAVYPMLRRPRIPNVFVEE